MQDELNKRVAWVEGEVEARYLCSRLADEIVNAEIPSGDSATPITTNKWEKVMDAPFEKWVTYQESYMTSVGYYKHTDGNSYPVYKIPDFTSLKSVVNGVGLVDANGYVWETVGSSNTQTGKKFQVISFTALDLTMATPQEKTFDVPNILVVNIPDPDFDPDVDVGTGKLCYAVQQIIKHSDGSVEPDDEWDEFRLMAEMPSDWDYFIDAMENGRVIIVYCEEHNSTFYFTKISAPKYAFSRRYYIADPVHYTSAKSIIKAVPDVPQGMTENEYFVMFEQPIDDYNYIDVRYGLGFNGSNSFGDPTVTYDGICDPSTVKPNEVPVIIDQVKACEVYRDWNDPNKIIYTPSVIEWGKDYDGATELVSPPYHFFYGRNSTVNWLPNKKRRPDYLVNYSLSINNDRVALVIEGDPAPDIHGFYRSFGYIGRIKPFNEYDYPGNFGVTVGMGDVDPAVTGFTINDIKEETNPTYAGWGEYTSNGMYSMSMLNTKSNVYFQAYYPAFLTQLPNYPSVGTIPPELSRLVLDKNGFQKSEWTDKYHASPIYLVHKAEGYRGYLDGVVAIHDHNLINKDELIVDTGIPKDEQQPELGNWEEVYKFFSIKSPINFFKYSPSPDVVTIAILKETR